ncbi:MAG: hypothetical protein NVSMB4_09540 [Acidimicrobiales bacterium]
MYFDVEGAGLVPDGPVMRAKPTLLLLHGGPGFDHSAFKPWWSRFGDTHQVVYYDHRGQGRSDGRDDPSGWRLDTWADDVVRLCDALEISAPVVLGSSFGGVVAMHYAARHPNHPAKLILSSCSARFDLEATVATFERLGGPEAAGIARRFWSGAPDESRADYTRVCMPLYTRHDVDFVGGMPRAIRNPKVGSHWVRGERPTLNLLDELEAIRCPTLVLCGLDDPIAPVATQVAMAARIPAHLLRFEQLADCGHGTYRDQPERTVEILQEFLAEPGITEPGITEPGITEPG